MTPTGTARRSHGGRPVSFDKIHYRDRNTVERAVNKLRGHRAVATRNDKRDYVYRGTVTVASIYIWLRDPVSNPIRDTPYTHLVEGSGRAHQAWSTPCSDTRLRLPMPKARI